ncbi:MAG: DUF2948 family protein [Pseudotabrizicola sp.]|uniref:DUF2948 family protein n=1 Tax=Pseudotabrizicola sp. TaxID=2939647 RepID=UPI002726FB0E|nr:DUF2948 family protein [Pseudotabrizicola sp.]MDO8882671.1 DUF2948 family protein [Pseudotabrizicola sp.]MDP2080381.1 DUF2948 family protein [Pseudotabrizicola sp.]MDZ7573775.1 DUF2948 family protein [Pseudotabrizicola sp.]
MTDARFEDGDERPLRLIAQEADDIPVMAALVQDAVFPITEMRHDAKARRFAILLNRFRWEDQPAAQAAKRPYERVRSLLVIEDVLRLRSNGIDRTDRDTVLSVLTLDFTPGVDGMGTLTLTLAGDGAIAIEVEAVSLRLEDVTRPYVAPSGKAPYHG